MITTVSNVVGAVLGEEYVAQYAAPVEIERGITKCIVSKGVCENAGKYTYHSLCRNEVLQHYTHLIYSRAQP
jgi:hypothetical protein